MFNIEQKSMDDLIFMLTSLHNKDEAYAHIYLAGMKFAADIAIDNGDNMPASKFGFAFTNFVSLLEVKMNEALESST